LNKEYFHVIGIEIRSDSYTALSIDLEGKVLFSETQPKGFTANTFKEEMLSFIKAITKRLESMGRHLLEWE
jgi:predicted NBD/HSP70 family sugar kinase